jgi:hypothetical protein
LRRAVRDIATGEAGALVFWIPMRCMLATCLWEQHSHVPGRLIEYS